MYPTFSDILKDLFGINIPLPIQSFGLFVAIAFLSCAYFFAKELKRKEAEGLLQTTLKIVTKGKKATTQELITSGIIGFILFYKLVYLTLNYKNFVNDTQGYLLSFDGNFIGGILGGVLSAYLKYSDKQKEFRKYGKLTQTQELMHPHEHVGNMTMIAAIAGLSGAKLFHILENFGSFIDDPSGMIFSFSGLTMYGGLIVGGGAVIYYAKKNKLGVLYVIDACAPALMLAYGVGRIGCHISGDGDWGIDNLSPKPSWFVLPDWAWAYTYPHNVNSEGIPIPGCEGRHCTMLEYPVFPTPFYEAVICIALFLMLWTVRKRFSMPGVLFSFYLMLNGTERILIEKIRVNTLYHIFGRGITQAEIISVILFFLGMYGIYFFRKRY